MAKKQKITESSLKGEIILYHAPDGKAALDVRLEGDSLWLTQKQISELFQTERSVITKHFGNIFRSGELDKNSVCAKFAHTAGDGKTYKTAFYNLDAIISVGYPSLEEKAAHLLYFLVKNHSFIDGNKRIAAALFLWFMEKNNALYNKESIKRIADNALVAITLMIAESKPTEKNVMVNLIVNLINKHN